MKAAGPRWKRQQWTVARAAALLAAAVRPKHGKLPTLADIEKRFGIGLREMMHLNAMLGQNEDISGGTQLRLELQFDGGEVRALGADRLSMLTRLSRVQAAFAAQALNSLAAEGTTRAFAAALAKRLSDAAGSVDDQLLIYRPSDSTPLRAKIALLHEALRGQFCVAFEYRGPSSKSAGRVADPLSLRRDQGVWRMLAWDHHRSELRTFSLEHLTKLVVTAKRFSWPEGLKPETIKGRDLSLFKPKGVEISVKLRLSSRAAEDWASVFTKGGKPDKQGWREASLLASNAEWIIRTFMPFCDEVKVQGPPDVKKAWEQRILEIAEKHH